MSDDARALAVGRAVLALVDVLGLGAPGAPATYDADRLPPGVTRDAYLRRHRGRMRAGVEGWSRVGGARLVTLTAWSREVETETAAARARSRREPPVVHRDAKPDNDVDHALDAALGLRRRAAR